MLAPVPERLAMDKLERIGELFAGLHFDREIIPRYVRWHLRLKLSLGIWWR
jgi:transposase-like protein